MAVNLAPWRKRQVELCEFEASIAHVIIPGQPGLYSKNMSQNKYFLTQPNPTKQKQTQLNKQKPRTPKVT